MIPSIGLPNFKSKAGGWDIANFAYVKSFDIYYSNYDNYPEGVWFNPTGTKMYVLGSGQDAVTYWNLSTAWNIATASYVNQFSISSQSGNPWSITFSPDGTKCYIGTQDYSIFLQYNLSTAWDMSTASFSGKSNNFEVCRGGIGMAFSPDGTKLYSSDGMYVYQHSLSTAWDISTASYSNKNFQTASGGIYDIFFKPDGTKFYVCRSNATIHQYKLTTAWDITTASLEKGVTHSGLFSGIFIDSSGSRVLISLRDSHLVKEYSI